MSDEESPRRELKRSRSNDGYHSDEERKSAKRRYGDRGRNDDGRTELRLLIPSKDAGTIIGKGGANIKRLREDFRAGVTVSDSRTPERVLTIVGELDSLHDVCSEVFKGLEEKYQTGRREVELTCKMLIHQSQAGCVIGKAGSQLKEFRQQYGVDIKVFADCCPRSTERIVQMIGKVTGVTKCVIAVLGLLKTWPPKGFNSPYDTANYEEEAVFGYGGYPFDERGGRGGGDFRGGRMDRDRGGRRSPDGRRFSDEGRDRGGQGVGPLRLGFGTVMQSRRSTQQVSIPADLAGVIIGKGGQKIKQIRIDSGADVELSDAALPGDRIITISGTSDQIQNAQYMLQTCVKKHLALRR